jgi:hypothetical protein
MERRIMTKFVKIETGIPEANIYAKVDDDGLIRYTCSGEDPEYQLWLTNQKPIKNQKSVG